MTRTIAGLAWRAASPSYWYLERRPSIVLLYDGTAWRFDFHDGHGLSWEGYPSRDVAARALSDGIKAYAER